VYHYRGKEKVKKEEGVTRRVGSGCLHMVSVQRRNDQWPKKIFDLTDWSENWKRQLRLTATISVVHNKRVDESAIDVRRAKKCDLRVKKWSTGWRRAAVTQVRAAIKGHPSWNGRSKRHQGRSEKP